MIPVIKWFDRKFEFGFASNMLPFFLERLEGTTSRIKNKVQGFSNADLGVQLNGKWSVKENIGHLAEVDEIANKRIHEMITGISPLSPAVFPVKQKYNDQSIDQVIDYFHTTRQENINRYRGLTEEMLQKKSVHPRLNVKMSPVDLAWFDAEHDDHHLRMMTEILSQLRTS
jgi:uncharacterized damage-inducible protein DinB